MFEGTCLFVFKSFDDHKLPVFPQLLKTTFLSRKFANTRSTKARRDSAAVHESQPTPATLIWQQTIFQLTLKQGRFLAFFTICHTVNVVTLQTNMLGCVYDAKMYLPSSVLQFGRRKHYLNVYFTAHSIDRYRNV